MDYPYYIYINTQDSLRSYRINGTEAAWNAYRLAVNFSEAIGGWADLVDGKTGEVLESTDED